MASRPIWRGQLRLALVSCPVALYNARHDRAAIRFNMINPATGNRIKMVSQDAETGEEIARRDTVKGYEFQKDRYLLLSDEDFDKVKVESSSIMAVEKFVEATSIDPIFYDASYYLGPDGKGSEDVYAVLRQAIQTTGKVALTRIVISQRERTVAVRPMGDGLVAHTLNEQRDLNEIGSLFEGVARAKVDPEMVTLAVQLVDRQTGQYDPADLEDRYETRLRAMLDAKVKGESESLEDVPSFTESNVVDLMAALRSSLGQVSQTASPVTTPAPASRRKKAAPEELRKQPAFKLPIAGGQKPAAKVEKVQVVEAKPPALRPPAKRQRAS